MTVEANKALAEEYEYDLAYTDDCKPHQTGIHLKPALAAVLEAAE